MSALLLYRRAIRGPAVFVDQDLWLVDPTLLIAMKPPDPLVLAVNQPAFSHDLAFGTSVLVELSLSSGDLCQSKAKKRSRPRVHFFRDTWKAPLLRVASSRTQAL